MGNTKLKRALRRNKLSEKGAARKLGISQSLINRITKDGFTPGLKTAAKIVAGFDGQLTFDDLLSPADRRARKKLIGVLVDNHTSP
ncbi:hypothetical protein LCGC14_1935370 [marine sediment metagenome]|uniref:HTH cro/C1-type domain-containing protein n=1 Tax=marine sediment metagenome TaxID=412755 RepID=A0A0F9I0F8_9ZZZZ